MVRQKVKPQNIKYQTYFYQVQKFFYDDFLYDVTMDVDSNLLLMNTLVKSFSPYLLEYFESLEFQKKLTY